MAKKINVVFYGLDNDEITTFNKIMDKFTDIVGKCPVGNGTIVKMVPQNFGFTVESDEEMNSEEVEFVKEYLYIRVFNEFKKLGKYLSCNTMINEVA